MTYNPSSRAMDTFLVIVTYVLPNGVRMSYIRYREGKNIFYIFLHILTLTKSSPGSFGPRAVHEISSGFTNLKDVLAIGLPIDP